MKKLRILFIVIISILIYTTGLAALVRNVYLSNDADKKWGVLGESVKYMAELPSMLKKFSSAPEFYVKNKTARDNFEVFTEQGELSSFNKLLVSYKLKPFEQKFELFDIKSGSSLKIWNPDNKALYDNGFNVLNPRRPPIGSDLYFMHPLMLPDSSLIFNSQLTSLLVRIDKDSKVIWLKNDRTYHHTSELDADGMIWVCSRPFKANSYGFYPVDPSNSEDALFDDRITKIDPENGTIVFDKAVIEILIENNLAYLVTQKGQVISDPIHLNDIQPALNDSNYWAKGDLLISCRNLSLIFLYRPSSNEILWLKQGPWFNQHDVDYIDSTRISIFGNDILREESTTDEKLVHKDLYFPADRSNNEIYLYDFQNDSILTPYAALLRNENVTTITSGRSEVLANGDIFVEDTNNGRLIFGDTLVKKAEFVKRIDDEHISSMFWSRLINN